MSTITAARRRAAPVLSAVLLLTAVTACGSDPEQPREGVTAQELTGDVSGDIDIDTARVGDGISLRATVVRVLSPDSFEISAADAGTPAPVLVLNREDDDLTDGQVVQVIGTVRLFDREELVETYRLADPSAYRAHSGQRFVLASEVDTNVPGDGR